MGDPTESSGGRFVSPERWVEALEAMGCRGELMPGNRAPLVGGDAWLRFSHAAVGGGRDLLIGFGIEIFRPARDVPPEIVEHHAFRLRRMRELKAPRTLIEHEAMNHAWVSGGQPAVQTALEELIDEARRDGWSEEDLGEELRWLEYWQKPDAVMTQSVLITDGTWSRAGFLVERVMAVAHAAAAGGKVHAVEGGDELLYRPSLELVPRFLAAIDEWSDGLFERGEPPEEPLFEGWDRVPKDDEEEDG